jgi:hypothetical protein
MKTSSGRLLTLGTGPRMAFAAAPAAILLGLAALAPGTGFAAEPPDKAVAAKAESSTPQADANKPGTTSAIVGGREVSVTAPDTTATVNVAGPNAEVRVGTRLLIVEKNQLTLDGKPLGPLPPDTRKVEVVLDKGGLVVKADGKEAARAPLQDQPQ